MEHLLNKAEIAYFYELLYKYEHESHAGYQDKKVIAEVSGDITLDDNHKNDENLTNIQGNVIQFTPYHKNKCWAILYHVRNAFAHGNLKSKDKFFLIKDYSDKNKRERCNMLALVEKEKFYKLIRVMNDTRKIPSNKKKDKSSKKRKK